MTRAAALLPLVGTFLAVLALAAARFLPNA